MIRTRHLYVFITLILSLLTLHGIIHLIRGGAEHLEVGTFVAAEQRDMYEVAAMDVPPAFSDRQGFMDRVRESLGNVPLRSMETSEPDTEVFVPDSISLVPEQGSVFACAGTGQPGYVRDVPPAPVLSETPHCLPVGHPIGILGSGAFLYSGVIEGRHESDACGGYYDAEGLYHYHTESACAPEHADGHIGYAFDGFPIYPSIEHGSKVTNEDLDACHGHSHTITQQGREVVTYHYHMTDEYPYSLGCFRGTPLFDLSE